MLIGANEVGVEDLGDALAGWKGTFREGLRLDNFMRALDAIGTDDVRIDYHGGDSHNRRWHIQPVGGDLPAEFINVPVTV